MSVINQMLRELDARRATRVAGLALQRTSAVPPATLRLPRRHVAAAALATLGATAVAAAWGVGVLPLAANSPTAAAVSLPAVAPVPVPASVPQGLSDAVAMAAGEPAAADLPARPALEGFASLRLDAVLSRLPQPRSAQPTSATSPTSPTAGMTTVPRAARLDPAAGASRPIPDRVAMMASLAPRAGGAAAHNPASVPAASVPAASASGPAASTALPSATHKSVALADTLQAARDMAEAEQLAAAVQLLRSALHSDAIASQPQALRGSLVVELARLELLRREPMAALTVLQQQADWVAQDAQAWSLRGNAAQRLGRHAEAIEAFDHALSLRPHEGVSLLGAAVSHAARGDATAAQALLARARAVTAVPVEVARYLQQQGVTVGH